MTKNLILGPILAHLTQIFFCGFYHYYQLDIVPSYHPMQFKGKLMNQTWENGKKPNFGPEFGPHLVPRNFARGFYLYQMLYIIASYHCMQFQGKLMNLTCENGKKSSFGPDFGRFWPKFGLQIFFSWVLPLLNVIGCRKLSLYAISRKTNEPNMRKWQKTQFWTRFWPLWPKFRPQILTQDQQKALFSLLRYRRFQSPKSYKATPIFDQNHPKNY